MKILLFDIPNFDGACTKVYNNGRLVTKAVRCNSGKFGYSWIPKLTQKIESSKFNTECRVEFTSVALKNLFNKKNYLD